MQSFGDFCLSVHPNPPVLKGKGRLRESMHLRYSYTQHKGIVVMLHVSPAQWCSSTVQLLPVCVYMAPTSAT